MDISIETVGRRHYLIGDTYSVRDRLRAAGAHWDRDRKAWWTGRRDIADSLVASLAEASEKRDDDSPGDDAIVAGRARYKGRAYYLAGRLRRPGGQYSRQYDQGVEPVSTRDGKYLLYFRDGSRKFWADRASIEVIKTYNRAQTIGGLRAYAEQARRDAAEGRNVPSSGRCLGCGGRADQCALGEAGFVAGYCYDCQ